MKNKKFIFNLIFGFSIVIFLVCIPPISVYLEYIKHVDKDYFKFGLLISILGIILGHEGSYFYRQYDK